MGRMIFDNLVSASAFILSSKFIRMKRVIILEIDNCTLSDIEELQHELSKRKKQLNNTYNYVETYDKFIQKARELYKDEENGIYDFREALCKSYELFDEHWIEIDFEYDEPPCVVDDCWYSGNLDRIGGATFYRNVVDRDYIVCDVCLSKADFDEFILNKKMIEDLKRVIYNTQSL